MKLRAQLKAKSEVEEQKSRLEEELAVCKAKASESNRKATRAVEHVRELKSLLEE